MIEGKILLFAFLGGVIPALIWLFFWLREDEKHPEPRATLILTFIAGMVSVLLILPIQQAICSNLSLNQCQTISGISTVTVILLALVEEIVKYIAAYTVALRTKVFDEPIDAVIYMITVALGFSALENTLFLISPLVSDNLSSSIIISNWRFIGASLLHLIASSTVGIFIAFSFYRKKIYKIYSIIVGLFLSITLHVSFNSSIMNSGAKTKLVTFLSVWIVTIILIAILEKIKTLKPQK